MDGVEKGLELTMYADMLDEDNESILYLLPKCRPAACSVEHRSAHHVNR